MINVMNIFILKRYANYFMVYQSIRYVGLVWVPLNSVGMVLVPMEFNVM